MKDEMTTEEYVNEQISLRQQKLKQWRATNKDYPNDFKCNFNVKQLFNNYNDLDSSKLPNLTVNIAGRIMTRRLMGKASFIHIQDMTGRIQIYLKANNLPDSLYAEFQNWDIGDIIGVNGNIFKTKTNELTIKATNVVLLTKSLLPLPDKYHGLTDRETCYRQRYLDLIINPQTKKVFTIRSKIVQIIREFLLEANYLEVETPMMHPIPGGATAKPFMTHHNALNMSLFLRVSPELYLKRLVVGGLERVFEINRNFRNEGLSTKHNPEFTMLEFYQAYADYKDLMVMTEAMFKIIAEQVTNSNVVNYQGVELDFSKPFEKYNLVESLLKYVPGLTTQQVSDLKYLKELLQNKFSITIADEATLGSYQFALFEEVVENKLVQPTFITGYPTIISPLARCNNDNPEVTDRFELFIAGREIANGFSELNDPEDQARRFKKQVAKKEAGDEEAMHYDADYITALEYGLPPTAGEGIGIDRLVMLFANTPSIRDVLLFPHMRSINN